MPRKMKKFPRYNGCLTIEYIPVVFNKDALGWFVVLPEVPLGA
jgi:hypothetical protein